MSLSHSAEEQTTASETAGVMGALHAIADAIVRLVKARLSNTALGIQPRLVDVSGAAVYLGRQERAIRGLVTAGKLPVVRIDGRVQFDVKDLDRVIENSKGDRG